jgi:hypothetical protein
MISENCRDNQQTGYVCRLTHCRSQRTQHIYSLFDVRLHDIFYVGSTCYLAERFAKHMQRTKALSNFKSMWLQNILESGSYPLPILLYEFQKTCDRYTREVEREIADCLRAEGHTARNDWYLHPSELTAYYNTILPEPHWEEMHLTQQEARILIDARCEFEMNLKEKWIEQVSEQVRVTAMLKEMFEA